MCSDAIEKIITHLELLDLVNICGVSKRLQTIAKSIFSRKYSHWLIIIRFPKEGIIPRTIHCRIEPIIRISDAKVWFKLIRNFGESIKYIRIECDYCFFGERIKPSLKYIMEYILEYCADSLEVLELKKYPFTPLNGRLKKLKKLFAFCYGQCDAIEYIPNVNCLWISIIPKILENICFSNMNELHTSDEYHTSESFLSFLRSNRQIKKLDVIIYSDANFILSSINEILPELKTLKIHLCSSLTRELKEQILFYRFKTVENFKIDDYHYIGSFGFDSLKRLSLANLKNGNSFWVNSVIRMKKLKILKFLHAGDLIGNYQILLTELTELEVIIICISTPDESKVLIKSLGREWEQIQMKKIEHWYRMKFQRMR